MGSPRSFAAVLVLAAAMVASASTADAGGWRRHHHGLSTAHGHFHGHQRHRGGFGEGLAAGVLGALAFGAGLSLLSTPTHAVPVPAYRDSEFVVNRYRSVRYGMVCETNRGNAFPC